MRAAIIVAGGSGERTGIAGGKQLAVVAGHPALYHTLGAFEECGAIDDIVVVVHPDRVEEYRREAVAPLVCSKVRAVVAGGPTRQESVACGLAEVPASADVIVIHDGARPLVSAGLIARSIEALEADSTLDGVVVGHPSYDTLKSVDPDGRVISTLDRSAVWAAQTPQAFRAEGFRQALAIAATDGFRGTDDASLVEHAGGTIGMIDGPRENIKITVPEDLLLVELLLQAREGGSSDE